MAKPSFQFEEGLTATMRYRSTALLTANPVLKDAYIQIYTAGDGTPYPIQ